MPNSSAKTRSTGSGPVLRSISPSGRFCSSTTSNSPFYSSSSAFASYTNSSFSTASSTLFNHNPQSYHNQHHSHHRSASPTRVNLYNSAPLSSSVKFSLDHRSTSPNRSIASHVITKQSYPMSMRKKTCMCSPTTHPGSFRCSLHKNMGSHHGSNNADAYTSSRLNMRRSAMKNSLVRIGGVEGEWVKRALTALIRPSSHHLKRRGAFEPRPSRLSVMSRADDLSIS